MMQNPPTPFAKIYVSRSKSAEPTTVSNGEAINIPSETTAPNLPIAR